jgi:hypothetical protein
VSPKPSTHIRACARPCYLAAWRVGAFLQVTGSNTNDYQIFQDIDIMVVPCSYHLIKWEDQSRDRLHIFPYLGMCTPLLPGFVDALGIFTSHRK